MHLVMHSAKRGSILCTRILNCSPTQLDHLFLQLRGTIYMEGLRVPRRCQAHQVRDEHPQDNQASGTTAVGGGL